MAEEDKGYSLGLLRWHGDLEGMECVTLAFETLAFETLVFVTFVVFQRSSTRQSPRG